MSPPADGTEMRQQAGEKTRADGGAWADGRRRTDGRSQPGEVNPVVPRWFAPPPALGGVDAGTDRRYELLPQRI